MPPNLSKYLGTQQTSSQPNTVSTLGQRHPHWVIPYRITQQTRNPLQSMAHMFPNLASHSLISISQPTKSRCQYLFNNTSMTIYKNITIILTGHITPGAKLSTLELYDNLITVPSWPLISKPIIYAPKPHFLTAFNSTIPPYLVQHSHH